MSDFQIAVDGRQITVRSGQTIGAALLQNGTRTLRRTRSGGEPRGMFCGIGMCFDCIVSVNDEPLQRACLRVAAPGDVVRTGTEEFS